MLLLREAESVTTSISELCRQKGISQNSFTKWRQQYGGVGLSKHRPQGTRNQRTRSRNQKLKKSVAQLSLDKLGLEELNAKMVTTDQKRDAVADLQSVILVGQSQPLLQRAACKVLGVQRALVRKPKTRCFKDAPLKQKLVTLSLQHPRYGYRRIHALACRTSTEPVNIKRLHRLWKDAPHRVPPRKKPRPHPGKGSQKAPQYALSRSGVEL